VCFAKFLYWYQLIYFVIKIIQSCGSMLIQSCLYVYRCIAKNENCALVGVIRDWISQNAVVCVCLCVHLGGGGQNVVVKALTQKTYKHLILIINTIAGFINIFRMFLDMS
jgi:hypothetical protein